MTLPTKEDVVSRLLHLHYKNYLTVKKCIENVVAELIEVWTKLSIVTRDKARIKQSVEKLYNNYYMLTKNKDRRSAPKIKREDDLQLEFKKVFDIAHKGKPSIFFMFIQDDFQFKNYIIFFFVKIVCKK